MDKATVDKATVEPRSPAWRLPFEVASTVVMLLLAAAFVWEGRAGLFSAASQTQPITVLPEGPLAIGTAPIRGSRAAKVAIVEFADFQCPACASFAQEAEPALFRDYVDSGRVAFIFKNFPLQVHALARDAAAAAWCAGEQDRFWAAHEWLYEQKEIPDLAIGLGLDMPRYTECLAGPRAGQAIEEDMREAQAIPVRATPTFFAGTMTADGFVHVTDGVVGAEPLERFAAILDRLLDE